MPFDIAAMDRMILSSVPGSIVGVFRASSASPDIPATFTVDDQTVESGGDTTVIEGGAVVTALQAEVGVPRRGAEFEDGGRRYTVTQRQPSTDASLVACICTVEDL